MNKNLQGCKKYNKIQIDQNIERVQNRPQKKFWNGI
jgi:hypothetical protein